MKILYIGYEEHGAAVAARALHAIAQDVAVTWVQAPTAALDWLRDNRDAAAVVVEVQAQSCAPFVEELRGIGLTTPVVVIAGSSKLEAALATLNAGADGYLAAGPSLDANLPRVLASALERERGRREHLVRTLADVDAARELAEHRRASAERALQEAERRSASELGEAAARFADLHADHTASRAREAKICTVLQDRLLELERALRAADERHASEVAALADQLTKRHAEFTTALAHSTQSRDVLAARLSVATVALDEAQQVRTADAAAATEHLRRREAEFEAALAQSDTASRALETALAGAEAAHQETRRRAELESTAASERHAALDEAIAQHADARARLEQRLAAVEAAGHDADERHKEALAAASARLAAVQAQYDAALEENARAARQALELGAQLADARAANTMLEESATAAHATHASAVQRADLERAAANERHAALEEAIAQHADARARLEQRLAAAEAAGRDAHDRHTAELVGAAARLTGLEARYDAALEDHAQAVQQGTALGAQLADAHAANTMLEAALTAARAAHEDAVQRATEDLAAAAARHAETKNRLAGESERANAFEQELFAAEAGRQDAARRHAAELDQAGIHLADLQSRHDAAVADHALVRAAFEQDLAAAATDRQQADTRAAAELAQAIAREAAVVERLAMESTARRTLERDLADARSESTLSRRRLLQLVSTHRQRGLDQKARLDAQIARERVEAGRELLAADEAIQQLQQERDTLRQSIATTQEQLRQMFATLDAERQAHEHARQVSESELHRLSAEYGQLRQSFDALQTAFKTLEGIAGEHVAERSRLEGVVADREMQLSAQGERHRLAEQAAQDAAVRLEERLRQAQETSRSEMARAQQEADALQHQLDAARTQADGLRGVAERVPDLQAQLELSQRERRREFERAPYGLCRCTSDGIIVDANHWFVSLLGRRRVDELRNIDFATAVSHCAGDLGWLIERARTTRKTESVETAWTSRDGRQLVVRLQALAAASGSIEIVLMDLTDVRAFEERLRRAQPMEAVGRVASEVAVTCDTLLRDVIRGANEWLGAIGPDASLRYQGERLVTDATRAAGLLRQLAVYGDRQARALEPVSAQRVLRNLAPVLQRVVGDRIELILSKSSGSFDVDVEAERLERVLVNVADYARQRMPDGGQMKIDLATTAVGRRFVARYPHVRPGDHVLITVTELPGTREFPDVERGAGVAERVGVELTALVELIGTCGGHLWMEAQPAGNMVVKIHLPKRAPAATPDASRPDVRADRGGRLARWFRSTPTPNVRA